LAHARGSAFRVFLNFLFHFSGYAIIGDKGLDKVALGEFSPRLQICPTIFLFSEGSNCEIWPGLDVTVKGNLRESSGKKRRGCERRSLTALLLHAADQILGRGVRPNPGESRRCNRLDGQLLLGGSQLFRRFRRVPSDRIEYRCKSADSRV
jgi:hypothetical protein